MKGTIIRKNQQFLGNLQIGCKFLYVHAVHFSAFKSLANLEKQPELYYLLFLQLMNTDEVVLRLLFT